MELNKLSCVPAADSFREGRGNSFFEKGDGPGLWCIWGENFTQNDLESGCWPNLGVCVYICIIRYSNAQGIREAETWRRPLVCVVSASVAQGQNAYV